MAFDPTPEQQACLDAFAAHDGDLAITAGAGAGKTSTLKLLSGAHPSARGIYLAYNRAIANEASASFPGRVLCQPDGTLVAVPRRGQVGNCNSAYVIDYVPIEQLVVGDRVVSWKKETGGGGIIKKRGNQIAGIVRRHYVGDLIEVISDGRVSRYTPEHPCMATLVGAFDGQTIVYLMRRKGRFKVGLCSWTLSSVRNGLTRRMDQEDPDALWILSAHENRDDALAAESLAQYQYQIPGWCFRNNNLGDLDNGGPNDRLWSRISDTHEHEGRAAALLAAHGRDIAHPLWVRGESRAFGAEAIVTAACNLVDGMRVLVADNATTVTIGKGFEKRQTPLRVWTKASVSRVHYAGQITSLEVENDHTYIADGIVTHNCKTSHALAFAAVGRPFAHRLNAKRLTGKEQAALLGIAGPNRVSDDKVLAPTQVARIVMQTIARFCYSADAEPNRYHVPRDIPGIVGIPEAQRRLEQIVEPFAKKAWADLSRTDGKLRFTHDCYLKLWQLSEPFIDADYLMLDEAQDTNPCVAAIFDNQTHLLRIAVGDPNQAIYGWRGATDHMSKMNAKYRLTLSQSFRFGQEIADEANKWLTLLNADLRITGYGRSEVRPIQGVPDALLCRTNAEAVASLIRAHDIGVHAALVGGGKDLLDFANAVDDLIDKGWTGHPELFGFVTWNQVLDYVENDHGGEDFAVAVKLIEAYGTDGVRKAIENSADERNADMLISTAHKAKGREWDRVRIADDFPEPKPTEHGDPGTIGRPDAMLAYVAVTRAKKVLDRDGLAFVDRYLPGGLLAPAALALAVATERLPGYTDAPGHEEPDRQAAAVGFGGGNPECKVCERPVLYSPESIARGICAKCIIAVTHRAQMADAHAS